MMLINFSKQFKKIKRRYDQFHLYDLGRYAVNRLTPTSTYRLEQDIAYSTGERHTLDLYHSKNSLKGQPLLVFVYGGAWQHGNKNDYLFIGESFAREGYDVAIINYRLAPEYVFPSYVDDLATALDFLQRHQKELQISTENLILMGHSAGAFNIMSFVYSSLGPRIDQNTIKSIIGLAGPYHFDYKNDPLAGKAFNQEINYKQVMPYYFVSTNKIRHYLFLAKHDQIVHPKNSTDLNLILQKNNNHSQIINIPHVGHILIIATLSSVLGRFFKTRSAVLECMRQSLQTQ